MTTSPDGEYVQVHNRLAEIHDRYGSGHLVSRSIRHATPLFLEAVGDVRIETGNTSQGSGVCPQLSPGEA
jgi:hypothetical protein